VPVVLIFKGKTLVDRRLGAQSAETILADAHVVAGSPKAIRP
jgi:hypothetical protein